MTTLTNKVLLSLLENNKEKQKENLERIVTTFLVIIDASLADATYAISKDNSYITITDSIPQPASEFPVELLRDVCDKIVRERGFAHVTIKIRDYQSGWSKCIIEIRPKYDVLTKSVQVDIVDKSDTDDDVVERIIHS